METRKLYYEDCLLRQFEARVVSCTAEKKGYAVILDATAFSPEGGGQPCDLGMLYAGTLTAVHGLDPQLERLFRIRKKDIRVVCDFEGDSSVVWARLDLSLSVARVLSLGLRHGVKALREYVKIMKLRKGGATQ